ncbi:tail completion protein gp17 [Sphingomonas sp. 3-13AW]|uniref:tail completion protein gp17 n=1 Tax=Sphingomonas sp. 3-13AW TaxID=3050450 RepID=UPI003BB7A270
MSYETATTRRLLDAPEVTALVEQRVDWDRREQGAPLSAITLETINDPRPQHFKGFYATRGTRVQVNCWAASRAAAVQLRDAVLAALVGPAEAGGVRFQRAQDISIRPTFERTETEELYREIIDITLWHNG